MWDFFKKVDWKEKLNLEEEAETLEENQSSTSFLTEQPTGLIGWLAFIGRAYRAAMLSVIPMLWTLVQTVGVIMAFVMFNFEFFQKWFRSLPQTVERTLTYMQSLLNLGGAIMSWSLPGWALGYLQFLNSILPLTEVFQAMSAIAGLYTICLLIRMTLKFTIIFR